MGQTITVILRFLDIGYASISFITEIYIDLNATWSYKGPQQLMCTERQKRLCTRAVGRGTVVGWVYGLDFQKVMSHIQKFAKNFGKIRQLNKVDRELVIWTLGPVL